LVVSFYATMGSGWSLPAWSPDESQIAFPRDSERGGRKISVVGRDGRGLHDLTHAAADDSSPAWSPRGRQIAFVSFSPLAECDA
jgi:Tol biopolymer transport system component